VLPMIAGLSFNWSRSHSTWRLFFFPFSGITLRLCFFLFRMLGAVLSFLPQQCFLSVRWVPPPAGALFDWSTFFSGTFPRERSEMLDSRLHILLLGGASSFFFPCSVFVSTPHGFQSGNTKWLKAPPQTEFRVPTAVPLISLVFFRSFQAMLLK